MIKKTVIYLFLVSLMVATSCQKENSNTLPLTENIPDSIGFRAKVTTANSVNKNWRTTSANANQLSPVGGIDFFANRGGINPDELTLMSFGKFTDDTSSNIGRLTIFIGSVINTGTFNIDGANLNNAVLSIFDGNNLEHYTSDINNQGSVIITKYDTINKYISGTFSFKLGSKGNIIKVENGVFTDIPFKQ